MEELFESPSTNNENVDFTKYTRGIIRRWWVVLACSAVVVVPWYVYLKKQPPIYMADCWLSFENVGRVISENLIENRMAKLRSRSYAEEVTAELGLTLKLISKSPMTLYRKDVFKTFFTGRNPIQGAYTLHFYSNGMASIWSENKMLDSVRVEHFVQDTASYCGFSFCLNPEILTKQSHIEFLINPFQPTAESLLAREEIIPQGRTLIQLTLKDTDPYLASETINMLADKFVQKSIELSKKASRFNREYLEEQLNLVQKELNETDYQLKNFRDAHIQDLDEESKETVNQLNQISEQISSLTLQKKDIGQMLSRLDPQSPNFETDVSIRYIYEQIMDVPVFQKDQEMGLIQQEWKTKYSELDGLSRFPSTNDQVKRINEDITELQSKISVLAQNKLKDIDDQIALLKKQEQTSQQKLNKLPQEELNLLRLNRQRRANEVIYEALNKNYKEAQINENVDAENISLYDRAVVPTRPITGDKRKKILTSLLFGILFGVSVAFFWEITDKSIRSREDIKKFLKLSLLGVIPKVKFDTYELQDSEKAKSISSQIVTHDYSPTPVGEAYRALRTSLLFSKTFGPVKSIVVSSVAPGEGKSFTAANLAITLAQQKSKTLLIDADFRRGVLHNSFNCPKKPGLTNYLTGVASLDNVLNETYIPNLMLITCGSMIPNPSELLGSEKMQKFIEGITHRFDFVIFDTPPLFAASDAIILGTLADGVVLIVRAGMTKRDDVQRKMELFQNVRAKVIGVVFNCAGVEVAHEGYSYYAY
jgi:succinoglycan biosynthesis transport protein ExoP